MMVWLLRGPGGKNILVDTGCYHENVVKGKGIQNLIKASEAIAKLGLSAGRHNGCRDYAHALGPR
jgi:hypothetical protein